MHTIHMRVHNNSAHDPTRYNILCRAELVHTTTYRAIHYDSSLYTSANKCCQRKMRLGKFRQGRVRQLKARQCMLVDII